MNSTSDPEQRIALELLRTSRRVILTGHVRPDGDCIGAQAALSRVLSELGIEVRVLNADPPDEQFDFLLEACEFGVDAGGELPEHDLVVLLDCSEISRTGDLAPRFMAAPSRKLVIDHHVLPEEAWWDAAYTDVSASATGLLVYRIARELGVELDELACRGVFTSIVADTGWFKYSNTDAETLAAAAELVQRGVQPTQVYGALYQRRARRHPQQVGEILARASYHAGGRLAVVAMPLGADGKVEPFDSEDVLDLLRAVEEVHAVVFVRELDGGRCKLSARSKTDYDVQALAARFGGGGHKKAAGASLDGPLEAALTRVIAAAEEGLN